MSQILVHDISVTVAEAIWSIFSTEGATRKTEQEMTLTAPTDGLVSSRGLGCVTPAPKKITGSWITLGGLNKNHGPNTKSVYANFFWHCSTTFSDTNLNVTKIDHTKM